MRFSALRARAILMPLGVALVSIAAVAWYDLVKIPAQQRYITDRNLRLLRTKSAQIKSKLDNFGVSIDNALHFYPKSEKSEQYTAELQRYMRKFASSVEIISTHESGTAHADEGPRVVVRRDGGRSFLYLEHRHGGRVIVAKADIEQAVTPFINAGSEFDAVLLATTDGLVIAQHSASGLELARVDGLRESSRPVKSETGTKSKDEPAPSVFARLRSSTNVENVMVGNAEYQMYVQPVWLSLATADGDSDGEEEWALCGLVRSDHFRAAGSAISYTYLLWFGVALAIVCLAIPLLKLHVLSPNERLRSADGVLVAIMTFLAAGLITFCAIDAYYFDVEVNGRTRDDLRTVALAMSERVRTETTAIAGQMRAMQRPTLSEALGYDGNTLTSVDADNPPATISIEGERYSCRPKWACVDNVLANKDFDAASYRYFDSVMWIDNAGWQRIKWSASRVTPLLSVSQLPYFQQLMASRIAPDAAAGSGVSVVQSRNSGDVLTIFWQALDGNYSSKKTHLVGQAMLATPMSLVNPVLPGHVQFAVIDTSGRVMFHTDAARTLRENFFVECEDNPDLRSAVAGRRSTYLNAAYLARSYAMYVTPLDLPSFGDPGWTLVVFEDRSVKETVNIETLVAAVLMFAVYAVLLGIGWVIASAIWPERLQKWFWPDRAAAEAYRNILIANGMLAILLLLAASHLDSTQLVTATAAIVAIAFVSTFLLVTRTRRADPVDPGWESMFHLARVSFLFVVAALPAIALFRAAYDFEMTLVDKHDQAVLEKRLAARHDRINARVAKFPLCDTKQKPEACPAAIEAFITARREAGGKSQTWDVPVATTVADKAPGTEPADKVQARGPNPVDALLALLHHPYNDVAVELASVLPLRRIERPGESGHRPRERTASSAVLRARITWLVGLVIGGIVGLLYVLVRFVVRPLYLLDLYEVEAARAADVIFDRSAHTLLIGPPGAGKSAMLANEREVRIFDARTRAFVAPKVATRTLLMPWRPSQPTATDWLDVSHLTGGRTAPVGIDHLEYSLDDPGDRPKMLQLLESLLYQHKRTVYVAAARDPIAQLRELTSQPPDAGEMSRWIRVFQSFSAQEIALNERPNGGSYDHAIWTSCSRSEQLALRQLADEDVVNPRSEAAVGQLMRRGLVRRDRGIRIIDDSFQRFVMQVVPADEISRREGDGVSLPWASKATAGVTIAVGIAMALVLASQQMVDAWIGYIPALAPAVPTMLKLFGSARDPKSSPINV